ncbi:DUF4376 domain-containing protein [Dickeya zeae]|uniref:DUF4376 domain-containing protein n=1 Tax=Dickeya zeae TaxID=204042 RepID=UPI001C626C6C|nr:DUF4376 domain-containing protein [Dickeya zeae]
MSDYQLYYWWNPVLRESTVLDEPRDISNEGYIRVPTDRPHPMTVWDTATESWVVAPDLAPPYIAAQRYQVEQAGVTFSGHAYSTTRESRGLLDGKAICALQNESYTCRWKMANGEFVTLSAPDVLAAHAAIDSYVEACFSHEESLLLLVASGGFTLDMLTQGWPSQAL